MKYLTTFLIAIMLLSLNLTGVFAQETEYASGEVESISPVARQLTIKVYDSSPSVYVIAADAVLKNISSLDEIAVSDYVDLAYITVDNGAKLVNLIKVYKLDE